jgi:hypothetical protein
MGYCMKGEGTVWVGLHCGWSAVTYVTFTGVAWGTEDANAAQMFVLLKKLFFFGRFRKIAKIDSELRHTCP